MLPRDFTEQEQLIAKELSVLGLRYEQQMVFGRYTVDFYIKELEMIIEADGIYGHLRRRDIARDAKLQGYPEIEHIVHIKDNTQKGVRETLWLVLNKLLDEPLPDDEVLKQLPLF